MSPDDYINNQMIVNQQSWLERELRRSGEQPYEKIPPPMNFNQPQKSSNSNLKSSQDSKKLP